MGIAYANLEEYKKAIECYKEAIKLNKSNDNEVYYYNMGLDYYSLKKYDKAIKCYQESIMIDPDYHRSYKEMGIVYAELGEYKKLAYCLKKVREIKSDKDKKDKDLNRSIFKTVRIIRTNFTGKAK